MDKIDDEPFDQNLTDIDDSFDIRRAEAPWQTMKRLWQTAKPQHARLYFVSACIIAFTVLSILSPWYSAIVVNHIWENVKTYNAAGEIFRVTWQENGAEIFVLFVIYLASWGFYSLQSFAMTSFAERLSLRLRRELSKKMNRLPLRYFDSHKTGETLSRFTNDLDKMAEALQRGVLQLFISAGLVIGSIAMMFLFQVELTLIFIGFTVLAACLTRYFSSLTLKRAARRQEMMSVVTGLVEEYYTGRILIQAFNQEDGSVAKIRDANEKLAIATEKADFVMNAVGPAVRMINRFGQICITVFAGKLLLEGKLSVGVFQAFFQYLNQAGEPLTEASFVINSMQSALASAERVYKLLDEIEMSAEPKKAVVLPHVNGDVCFENVRFGYTPENELMKNIHFTVRAGQKIAIVGETGAGKTTLINLLMRFYDTDDGKILLDGVETDTMTRRELRSHFGMVLQDTWLFGGTIAENIAYGKPDATTDDIIRAAKAARVDFFVSTMPDGYDTILDNDVENISVGQRQLLTIARVVLYNPAVLILDEATSSVDTRTELEINKAMHALMEKRTCFVIAHRLSTIVDADLILVMDKGNIVEQGTHADLLKKGGVYADLYNSQFAVV